MIGRGGLNDLLRCFSFFTTFLDPSFKWTGDLDKRLEFRTQLCVKWSTTAWLEINWLTHNWQIPMLLLLSFIMGSGGQQSELFVMGASLT